MALLDSKLAALFFTRGPEKQGWLLDIAYRFARMFGGVGRQAKEGGHKDVRPSG